MAKGSPAVAGKNGNAPYEQQLNQADRTGSTRGGAKLADPVSTPPVDGENTRGSATEAMPHGQTAESAHTNGACRIEASTNAFALRLTDGQVMDFDDSSNGKIAQQLQSGNRLKQKSIHAKVKGSLVNGMISADSVKL